MRQPPKRVEVEGESVYLRKSWTGWDTVEPFTREDGSRNWFAGWKKSLVPMLFLLLLISLFIFTYRYEVNQIKQYYGDIAQHPVSYCEKLIGKPIKSLTNIKIDQKSQQGS